MKQSFLNTIKITAISLFFVGFSQSHAIALEDVGYLNDLRAALTNPTDIAVSAKGDVFVIDDKQSIVFHFDPTGQLVGQFGSKGSKQGQFSRPQSIAINQDNQLVVADTGNSRVQVFDTEGQFLFQFGNSGSTTGQFRSPEGVITDHFNFIYVADTGNSRIQMFSPGGVFLKSIATEDRPIDIAVDPLRNIYVLQPKIGYVTKYSSRGEKLQSIECNMGGKNYLERSFGLAVDDWGDIYITENTEHSVKKFNQSRQILASFGSEGDSRGQFYNPLGIATDASSHIYVVDSRNKRVQIFKIKGTNPNMLSKVESRPAFVDFSHSIGMEEGIVDLDFVDGEVLYALSEKGNYLIENASSNKIIGEMGRELGQFKKPNALFIHSDDKIYVADTGNSRVQVLNKQGAGEYHIGKRGSKNGWFSSPKGIVVNRKGDIYVADTQNNRIQRFNDDGIFLTAFGERSANEEGTPEAGNFRYPTSLTLDSLENLYVLDSDNHRIQVFDPSNKYIRDISYEGTDAGLLNQPTDIVIDGSDNLFIADQGNNRVQVFDGNGLVAMFGSAGKGPGQFSKVSAIDVHDNRVYVADYATPVVKVFNYYPERIIQQSAPEVIEIAPAVEVEEVVEEEEEFELQ